MKVSTIFDEIAEFMAQQSPKDVLAFKPTSQSSSRYEELISKEKSGVINPDELEELNNYQVLEMMMRRAKAKARMILNQ